MSKVHAIRVRVALILLVVGWSVWSIHPPEETISLGLDLKGGVHLVLRVQTDDALQRETEAALERLGSALEESGSPVRLERTDASGFLVEDVRDQAAFRRAAAEIDTLFDRAWNGGRFTFRMKPDAEARIRRETVRQAQQIIERRVNELGLAEPVVARYTRDDQILVQLPGVPDADRAKAIIRSTAQLRLTLVERGPFPSREAALLEYKHALPPGLEVLPGPSGATGVEGAATSYVVRKGAAVAGTDLRSARQSVDEFNRPAVAFTLTPGAAQRFGRFTEQNVNRVLATVLDDRVVSVATILGRIDGEGQIVGVSREEMAEQIVALNAGALPASLEYVEENRVGASLGREAVRAGVAASAGGLALVALFMVAYYKLTGLNALVSILLNLLVLIALVASIPATMTLPGIAGLILTIGMGVDSNVLIFERIKEELAAGRTARASVQAGFDRVWITIVDTHVASMVAAAFLFQFGTSSIRGFATTLTLGLMANVFTAVFVSKTLFELVILRRGRAGQPLSI